MINDQKFPSKNKIQLEKHIRNKKFNTKGYFREDQPFNEEYLKKKHQTYEKYRLKQNKENYVYNLRQQRMANGYYEMKGCKVNQQIYQNKKSGKRRILKTIISENNTYEIQHQIQKNQKIISSLLKKYINRKHKLAQRSQRSLSIVFSDVKNQLDSKRSLGRCIFKEQENHFALNKISQTLLSRNKKQDNRIYINNGINRRYLKRASTADNCNGQKRQYEQVISSTSNRQSLRLNKRLKTIQ